MATVTVIENGVDLIITLQRGTHPDRIEIVAQSRTNVPAISGRTIREDFEEGTPPAIAGPADRAARRR